jgi:hypothetical protein
MLSFRHLGQCFVKPGDSEDISGSGAANFWNGRAAQKISYDQSAWVTALSAFLFYSVLLCSFILYLVLCEIEYICYIAS